ncbi:MAG: recombinase family protein [Alphaproteobacteria bacterium]|nr:recombinase family protein [Alphaproteobacteria bacterium]MBR6363536.1 recombinase family protein [Alphaproteobacteria bacterium]
MLVKQNTEIIFNKLRPCNQAIAFARVSKDHQAEGVSLDAQIEKIREYCNKHNFSIIKEIKLTESSTRGDRKEFHKMLEFVKKQKNKTAIVVYCVDRFQRSFKESAEIEALLKDDIIEVHFWKDSLILTKNSPAQDITRWNMGILAAKMYVDALRENVKRSMEYNWKEGVLQNRAPTGYINVTIDKKKTVIIDDERGPLVKKMFEEYATGLYSLKDMVVWARTHNLKSRRANTTLCRAAIHAILQNPFYCGTMLVKGNYIKHIYTPLIDEDLFNTVQERLSGKATIHTKTEYGSMDFALRGLFRCGKCGCTMTPELHTKKSGKQYSYLKCSHTHGNCDQKPINENLVFQQIEEVLVGSFNFSEKALSALKASVREYIQNENGFNRMHKQELQKRLKDAKNRLDTAINMLFDGVITKEVYEVKKPQLDNEIAEIEKELTKCANDYNEIGEIIENIVEIAANAGKLIRSSKTDQKRALLKLILANSTIIDKKAWISLTKPFDLLQKSRGCTSWLGQLDSNQY